MANEEPRRWERLFLKADSRKLLSVFFTAGFPDLNDTGQILKLLQQNGVDLVEIGFPYSDSLVDGPTIQRANERALQNGMTLSLLFEQIAAVRAEIALPLVLMTCINPPLQYGLTAFAERCREVGLDGLIIPDLPPELYRRSYQAIFQEAGLPFIFLVTRHCLEERIRELDELSGAFLYAVSSDAVTGQPLSVDPERRGYLQRLAGLKLKNPVMVGFGISDRQSFESATQDAAGGIIGSAFIRALEQPGPLEEKIATFIKAIRLKSNQVAGP